MSHPPALLRAVLLGATIALVAPSPSARAGEDPGERWQEVEAQALDKLLALADWCTSAKLFGTRAEVYEAVLVLDPDHGAARRWLRYRRDADGGWSRRPDYRPPKDRSRKRSVYDERKAEFDAWVAAEAGPLAEAAQAAGNGRLAAHVVRVAAGIPPGSAEIRRWNREVPADDRSGRRWILLESQRALARRADLQRTVERIKADTPPPQAGTPEEVDRPGDVAWGRCLQGEHVRLLGTPDDEEMQRNHVHCEAVWPVFHAVLGLDAPVFTWRGRYGRGVTVYVFTGHPAGNAFLAAQPTVTQRFLQFVDTLVGTWIPQRAAIVVKSHEREVRLESPLKLIAKSHFKGALGLTGDHAWVREGLGHYFSHLIAGTRRIGSVRDRSSRYGDPRPGVPERQRNTPEGDGWLHAGLALVSGPAKPNLHLAAGKGINEIQPDEVLYGYCCVAYLVEGWPEECAGVFRALGDAEHLDLDAIFTDHLAMDATTFERRVRRWLEETVGAPPAR